MMINQKKISIYKKYNGDIDNLSRSGTKKEKTEISDSDWHVIGSFLQDITMVKNGLASKEFEETLRKSLLESCDSEETIEQMYHIDNKK